MRAILKRFYVRHLPVGGIADDVAVGLEGLQAKQSVMVWGLVLGWNSEPVVEVVKRLRRGRRLTPVAPLAWRRVIVPMAIWSVKLVNPQAV